MSGFFVCVTYGLMIFYLPTLVLPEKTYVWCGVIVFSIIVSRRTQGGGMTC